MGEAKRRKASQYGILREELPGDSAKSLVGSVLQNIADILNCAVFLKEPGDALLDWPADSIVGEAREITKVKECPFVRNIRGKIVHVLGKPRLAYEFLINDAFLCGAYETDIMKRGLPYPGPINPPENIAEHARNWFKTDMPMPGGWKGVIPTSLAALARQPGAGRAN